MEPHHCSIKDLNPYNNKRILARVLHKSEIKSWSNARGEGVLFRVLFGDETGQITAVGFGPLVQKLYPLLENDTAYYVSRAEIRAVKNKRFANAANEYELQFLDTTIIEECKESWRIPTVKDKFVALEELHLRARDDAFDVIAVVIDAGDLFEIQSRDGKKYTMRVLTLVDQAGKPVKLTLFEEKAIGFDHKNAVVVAFRGVKLRDPGRDWEISMTSWSSMDICPRVPEKTTLEDWYTKKGRAMSFKIYSRIQKHDPTKLSTIAEIRAATVDSLDAEQDGYQESFSCRATIVYINPDNIAYPSCPGGTCLKKATEGDDEWTCTWCKSKYFLSIAIADHTGKMWLSGFADIGRSLFGDKTANDMMRLKDNDKQGYEAVLQSACTGPCILEIKVKIESQDIARKNFHVERISPVEFKEAATSLLAAVRGC